MYLGLDLGSRNVKMVLMEDGRLFDYRKYDTVSFYRQFGRIDAGKLTVDFPALGLDPADLVVVATGYGRQAVRLKSAKIIPELRAHVNGAGYLTGLKDFTLLDLGGQDSKVIQVRGGKIKDFLTNDKCAASTGRYLENMAAVLNIDLKELGKRYSDPVDLTSTCAIFGESELIEKIVEGHSIAALAAGVNYSIFKRVKRSLTHLLSDKLVFTGGVAYSKALVEIIRGEMGLEVLVPDLPEYTGAVGCALER